MDDMQNQKPLMPRFFFFDATMTGISHSHTNTKLPKTEHKTSIWIPHPQTSSITITFTKTNANNCLPQILALRVRTDKDNEISHWHTKFAGNGLEKDAI